MPLTDYQATLARLLSENRTFDSYLAGGAAILIEPNTTRFSRDLDYFHDSEARVAEAFAADRRLLVLLTRREPEQGTVLPSDAGVLPSRFRS